MIFLLVYIIVIIACTAIGSSKNRPGLGFALGALLGLLGLVIILITPAKPPNQVSQTTVIHNHIGKDEQP
jgi:hypothetical protein